MDPEIKLFSQCKTLSKTPPCTIKRLLSSDLGDGSTDSRGVGATDGVDQLAVLVEEEGGHSRDTVVSGDVGEVVDVDLVELDVVVGLAELVDSGGDGLARTAPLSEEVDDDGLLGVGNEGLVLLSTANKQEC